MVKIFENKIILEISKNNLMSSVKIDLERNSPFINIVNIETINETINSEINIKKEDKDKTLMINEFQIINNEIKLKSNYTF